MEEIDRVRGRVISTESSGLNMYEKFNHLAIKLKEHTQQILTLDTWNHKIAKQTEETNLECKKIVGLIDTIERV